MKKYSFNEINEVFYHLTKKEKNREKEIIIGGKIAVKQITNVNIIQETVDVFSF